MAAGGPGVVNLGINASGFITQINTLISSTTNYNTAIGQLNAQFNQFNVTVNNTSSGLGGLNGQLRTLAAIASVQALNNLYHQFEAATKEAAEFSRSIGLIQTITADAKMGYDEWADGIRKVSDALGMPLAETSAAAYDLLSNQITRAADTFDVLSVAGNLANITNSSVTNSVNTLSNAINAYGYDARDAEMLSAKLFTTVDLGRVKLNELANTSGRVYETGKSLGVGFDEVNAGLIAITQTGVKTDTAMTLLTNVFQKLLKPTKELQELYDKNGVTPQSLMSLKGLAGVIQLINQETSGDSTKVHQYFNEIRSFQGFQILTDQAAAFNNGLEEQKTSLERARAAKEAYEKTPGFRYQQQSQELSNALTTGIKTELLDTVLSVTEKFGGLKQTMLAAFGVIGSGSASMVAFQAALALSEVTAVGLAAAIGTIAWPVTAAVGAAALAHWLLTAMDEADQLAHMHEALGTHWGKINREAADSEVKDIAKTVQAAKDGLNEKQKALLEYTTKARQALTKIGDGLDTVGDRLKDQLKNAVELSLGSARDSLKEIESRLNKALANVSAARKGRGESNAARGDSLYNARLALDQAQTGGANERTIIQRRLNELNAEMARAARRGDKESFDAAHGKAEGIINAAATATDENGNLKYAGQLRAINELYDNQLGYLKQIELVNRRNADTLASQKTAMAAQVKEAEDAGKALYELDVVDKQGKPLFNNRAEFETEAAARKQKFDAALEALRKNPNADIGGQFRGANYLEIQRQMGQRDRELREKYDARVNNRGDRQDNRDQLGKVDATEAAISKLLAEAIKRLNQAADDAQKATYASADAKTRQNQSLGAILAEGAETGQLFKDQPFKGTLNAGVDQERLNAMGKQIQEAADKGDYAGAQKKLKELSDFLQSLGNFDKEVMTTGPRDSKGALVNKTPRQAVGQLRYDLAARERADGETRGAKLQLDQAANATPQALGEMEQVLQGWKKLDATAAGVDGKNLTGLIDGISGGIVKIAGDLATAKATLDRAIANNRVTVEAQSAEHAEAPAASKSMGGFAGYFAAGGQPRGIDTALVRMDPSEMIMNPQASMRFRSQLQAMNAGWDPGTRGQGPTTNVGDIHVNVQGGPSSRQTVDEIASGLQRRIRQGTIRLGR